MRVGELEDLFLRTLLKQAGGNQRRWRLALGPVTLYDPATHPHCNWNVSPTGSAAENAVIERLADDLRIAHPRVVPD
ncbi:MAG: hypothetical protein CMN72_02760 [Sphingomonas sp.]|nr:hypothetical protein [Sphingomonas sp.]